MQCGHLETEWNARKMRPKFQTMTKIFNYGDCCLQKFSYPNQVSISVFFGSKISPLGDQKKRGCEGLNGFLGKILIKVPIFQA